jgi:hypothetical protein
LSPKSYIFLLTGLFSLAEMSEPMYTISWSPNPGSGTHMLTRDGKRKIYIWKKANKDKLEDQASEMAKQFKEKFWSFIWYCALILISVECRVSLSWVIRLLIYF